MSVLFAIIKAVLFAMSGAVVAAIFGLLGMPIGSQCVVIVGVIVLGFIFTTNSID